jgi:hypothetical protein
MGEMLITLNKHTSNMIQALGPFSMSQSTLADNTIQSELITLGSADAVLANDIFVTSNVVVRMLGGTLSARNILGPKLDGLPTASDIVIADPAFLDATHGDYRLKAISDGKSTILSPAIDFASTSGSTFDIDGRTRPMDIAGVTNRFGSYDLGAFEMQPITDRVFANGYGDPYLLAE